MDIVYHFNPSQPHQIEHGKWLFKGFKKHGLNLVCTDDVNRQADVHIVSGPHYAKNRWINHDLGRVLLIDRAYIPGHQYRGGKWASEDYVSIGWMNRDGTRSFVKGSGKPKIQIQHCAAKSGTIFLADYNGLIVTEGVDTVRQHPANLVTKHSESLKCALSRHKYAFGYNTTALVTAALLGLETKSLVKGHILNQDDWLGKLPYADWSYNEIENGDAWEHLQL